MRPLVLLLQLIQTNSAAKAGQLQLQHRHCKIPPLSENSLIPRQRPSRPHKFAKLPSNLRNEQHLAAACLLNTYSLSWDSSSKIKARGAVYIAARPLCTPNIYRIQVLRVALELLFLQVLMLNNLQPSITLLHSITPIFIQQTRQQTGTCSTLAAQACSCPLEETSTTT